MRCNHISCPNECLYEKTKWYHIVFILLILIPSPVAMVLWIGWIFFLACTFVKAIGKGIIGEEVK